VNVTPPCGVTRAWWEEHDVFLSSFLCLFLFFVAIAFEEESMSQPVVPGGEDSERLSGRQWLLLFILAAVQFTHIVDFIIIMPLAPQLEKDLGIGTQQFAHVVSAYGGAACLAGLLLASLLDHFDRKRCLLVLYAGFTLGTVLCAFAPSYAWLLVGRAIAGAFGGVTGATVLAIVGDAYPDRRRGLATGVVMSAFSIASIAGIPAGLWLTGAAASGWRAPFLVLGAASALVWLLSCWAVPVLRGHMVEGRRKPGMWEVASQPAHLKAYTLMFVVVFGGFLIGPYSALYLVKNVGLSEKNELPLVYLVGGIATLVSMNLVGRLSDRIPRLWVFRVLALATLGSVVLFTQLPEPTPLVWALAASTLLWVLSSGRMVPATAMVTSASLPYYRGTFLSINASVQQLAAFLAPLAASLFLSDHEKRLEGYGLVGLVTVVMGLVSVALAGLVRPAEEPETVRAVLAPVEVEDTQDEVPAVLLPRQAE
jgi:predicted MFS family arabinose efflux permease